MPQPAGQSHFVTVTVAVNSYPGPADVSASFRALGITLKNRGTDPLFFSHDGTTNHGRIEASQVLVYRDKFERQFWFKRASGAASNDIDVTMWG